LVRGAQQAAAEAWRHLLGQQQRLALSGRDRAGRVTGGLGRGRLRAAGRELPAETVAVAAGGRVARVPDLGLQVRAELQQPLGQLVAAEREVRQRVLLRKRLKQLEQLPEGLVVRRRERKRWNEVARQQVERAQRAAGAPREAKRQARGRGRGGRRGRARRARRQQRVRERRRGEARLRRGRGRRGGRRASVIR